jgi:phospholipid/cholesterol/gamma-HCH transport system substrate-binding protein
MKITREAKIGLFAVICIAVLFWGVNFLKGKNVFSRTNIYYAVYNRVDGLKPTNDVLLSGFKVGLVKDIKFEQGQTGRLIVTILVEKKYSIPHNSVLKLISADIMGGKALRLDVTPNNTFHESGDTLTASIETGLLDQLMFEMVPIKEKAESLMGGLETTLDIISKVFNEENRDNLDQSFVSLKNSLDNIDNLSGQLNGMLTDEEGKLLKIVSNVHYISQNLRDHSEDFDLIIKNFSSISDSLAQSNLARTLAQIDSAMLSLNAIVTRINKGEGSMGMLINNDTLYTNLENAAQNLEHLLYDMKINPKRYINISLFDFSRTKYQKEKK